MKMFLNVKKKCVLKTLFEHFANVSISCSITFKKLNVLKMSFEHLPLCYENTISEFLLKSVFLKRYLDLL